MKNLLALTFVLFVGITFAQEGKPKTETVTFKVSAVCDDCKKRIEKELNYTSGVVFAELNLETKEVTVKFKTKSLDPVKVKKIVAAIGYDAGEIPRDAEAFKKLPGCCQSEGHCNH